VLVLAAVLISFAQTGVGGTSLANPHPVGTYIYDGVPRAHPPFLGITNWPLVFEVLSLVLNLACWATFGWLWWRRGTIHPALILMFALWIAVCLTDPLANWGYSAAYDPRMLHFPIHWPYVSLAPTVEPLSAVAGWQWWYLLPGLAGFGIWRHASRRVTPRAWINRHPLWGLFLIGFAVGAAIDVVAELVFIKSGVYTYTQLKGPLVGGGHTWQFPVVWGPLFQILLYGLTTVFLWRDDRGQTVCGLLGARLRLWRHRPVAREVAIASSVLLVSYLLAIGTMAILKYNASTIAKPWPYQETKTYDPTGLWQRQGQPGPFYKGN
jgi:hypothetical protein